MNSKLFPADIYEVVNKSLLNENDKQILNLLYMPIIGNIAVTLYNTLYNELKTNNYISSEYTHHHLMTNLGESLEIIKEARIKLEGIGLLKTYYKEGNVNSYVYELYSPLSVNEFFSHPILNIVLYNNIGKEEYLKLKSYFKTPKLDLTGYSDITTPFDMAYKSITYSNFEMENEDIIKKNKLPLSYEMMFDFDALTSSIPKRLLHEKALNKTTKELIANLAFLYDLDPLTMANIIKVSVNEKGLIEKEILKNNTRKHYEFDHNGRLPSLVFKNQPEYLKNPNSDNSKRGLLIRQFETTTPFEFLKSKYKGVKPTTRDMKILEMLLTDVKLKPAVVNVLIDYVLKTQDNQLVKSYIETIAGEWRRAGIETAKDAMEYAEKKHKKITKIQNEKKEKVIKEEKTPEWFNKKVENKEISKESKAKLENIIGGYK